MKGKIYRAGIWSVKPTEIEAFISKWQESAAWLAENHPVGWGGEAFLLQDIGRSNRFISFAWSTMPEKTEELLGTQEFQGLMESIVELCEEIQPHRMQIVGHSVSE